MKTQHWDDSPPPRPFSLLNDSTLHLPLYNGLFLNTVISVSGAVNTHLLKVGGLDFWGAEVWPYLGPLAPPPGCKVSVKMLSRHEKHPAPSVMEWGKAAALWGTRFEGRGSNDLISLCGLQWRRTQSSRCCFQIRPASVTDARGAGGWWRAGIASSGSLLSHRRTGTVLGLWQVWWWRRTWRGVQFARWSPDTHHHVGLWFPAAEGWLSAWQSLVHLQPVTMIVPGSKHFLVHCLMLLLIWWQGVRHNCRRGCAAAFHK